MRHQASGLRKAGWVLAIIGVSSAAVLNLTRAYLARGNAGEFNGEVSWANVLSMVISAIGVILVMLEKLGALSDFPPERVAALADDLALEALRQDGELRARLLSTDVLDSRPAEAYFRPGRSGQSRKRGRMNSKPEVREFAEITDYFNGEANRRLVILGAPGVGKTVLAVTLTVDLLQQRKNATAEQRGKTPVPCLFYLPSWNTEGPGLEEWLESQVAARFRIGRKAAERLVHEGHVLPVLDGLDEMDSQETNSVRSQSAVSCINEYIARAADCQIVVICRSGVKHYERLARRVANAREVTVENLTARQILSYIRLQNPDDPDQAAWQPVMDVLQNRAPDSSALLSQLNSPWRFVAAVVYGRNHDPATLLPSREEASSQASRAQYPRRVSNLLMKASLDARIAANGKDRMAARAVQRLRTVAALLATGDISRKEGTEIVLHDWWKAFPERTVNRTQLLATHAITTLPYSILWFLPIPSPKQGGLTWYLGVVANYMLIQVYSFQMARHRKVPIALRVAKLRTARNSITAAGGIIVSGLIGWTWSIMYGSIRGAALGAAFEAAVILITASTGMDIADASRPVSALVNDRNMAAAIGFALGSFDALYLGGIYGASAGVMLSLTFFLGAMLGSSYGRYLTAIYLGLFNGMPVRLAAFMEWCHSVGILRLSGAGYQFRHRELLDYLVEQEYRKD